MHVVTDDERREVAARLRECRGGWTSGTCYYTIIDTLGLPDTSREDGGHALYAALADLIDPGDTSQGCRDTVACESGRNLDKNRDSVQKESPAVPKAPACDRDALLALADGMLDAFRVGARSGEGIDARWCRELHDDYARRIREACGEVDA